MEWEGNGLTNPFLFNCNNLYSYLVLSRLRFSLQCRTRLAALYTAGNYGVHRKRFPCTPQKEKILSY